MDLETLDPDTVMSTIAASGKLSVYSKRKYKEVLGRYCEFRGIQLSEGFTEALRHQKRERVRKTHKRDLVSIEELKDIIEHTRSAMLQAYYAVLWDSGARPSGIARLNLGNISEDRFGFTLHISKAKNEQSQRSVRLLTPLANQHLRLWLSVHPERTDLAAPLFMNRQGNRISVRNTYPALRVHNQRLGRGNGRERGRLSLYLFRKSWATQLLKEQKLNEIQLKMRMGHAKKSTMLEEYYAIIDESDQEEAELAYLGVSKKTEDKAPEPVPCPNCGALNDAGASSCSRCRLPLSEKELLRQQQQGVAEAIQTLRNSGALQAIVDEAVEAALKRPHRQEP